MNRNTRLLIVLAVAVLTATLASVGVYQAVRRIPPVRVETPSTHVVVAAKSLETGVRITDDDVKLVPWPSRNLIAGAFEKTEGVVDRGLVVPVLENEPITEGKLAPVEAGAGLPPAIRPGMRAMSVKVNEVIGVAGFVVPGAHVDVLVTLRQERDSMSRVVVSNVEVLTAGTRYDQGQAKKDAKPIPTTVVTLMVRPGDAERIALAANEGQIMLALRNPLDLEATESSGVRKAALLSEPIVKPVARRRDFHPAVRIEAQPPEPPSRYVVETFKATKKGQEVVP